MVAPFEAMSSPPSFTNVAEVTAADQPDSDSTPGDGEGDDWDDAVTTATAVLGEELPQTGMDADRLAAIGLAMVIAGAFALLAVRRREDGIVTG